MASGAGAGLKFGVQGSWFRVGDYQHLLTTL